MDAIYARQSLDKKDSISIQTQIEFCQKEASINYLVYQDKGFSGKNTNRPEFQRMMEEVKSGRLEKVIVYRLDRLSRSIIDFAQMWEIFQKNGVEFVSINEKFDTATPMGKAMLYIIMVFAQLERETIALRVKDNYYSRIKTGSWPGGPAPYGFKNIKIIQDGRNVPSLEPIKEEIDVVYRIYMEYVSETATLGNIAKMLSLEGIPCRHRKGWDNVALSRMLHSPVYVQADERVYDFYRRAGVKFSNPIEDFNGLTSAHLIGKRRASDRKYTNVENHVLSLTNFSGIIPADVWLKCQKKLAYNKQVGNIGKGKATWLSGLLKCKKCGYSITVRKSGEKLYFGCSGNYNVHICTASHFMLKVPEVEEAVRQEIERYIEGCRIEESEYYAICGESSGKASEEKEIARIEAKIANLLDNMAEASNLTMKYINEELGRLDAKKNELLAKEVAAKCREKNIYQDIVFAELSRDEKRLAAITFIEKILIDADSDEIEIIWKE